MPPHLGPPEPTFVHGLRHQARCLASLPAAEDRSLFVAATWSPQTNNEVHLVEVDEELRGTPLRARVFRHNAGLWCVAGHPRQLELIACCEDAYPERPVTLLRIPGLSDAVQGTEPSNAAVDDTVERVASGEKRTRTRQSLDKVATLASAEAPSLVEWQVTTTARRNNGGMRGWDVRSEKQSYAVPFAHDGFVRAVDCNPNVPHHFATGGDDGMVRIWDARRLGHSLLELAGHTHCVRARVWSVAYNEMHDQLLLTGGSDARVNLQSVVSTSSAAYGSGDPGSQDEEADEDEEDGAEGDKAATSLSVPRLGLVELSRRSTSRRPVDGLVKTYTDHDDSVYGVAWSHANPWLFASVSYSGRLLFSQVPSSEKYKILL
ncbi:WD40-repeat-containing domain protein [Thamnocephalis sphaerospora]|uniref:WD40-repeat-containing domain protein n=1 Tax=Thamnocephalis sphaerospora TaxID=78915 RepID=A0A4V1IWY7_9FUNG|nr:WD40-repeat-containing domain protein [Thamnocephalis sphaerospora]|eukprot:RKP09199.1 WD40-repeat-containing domain protein [Thamnocephalis sphaerospora]